MFEFFKAASLWIVMGLFIAVSSVLISGRKR